MRIELKILNKEFYESKYTNCNGKTFDMRVPNGDPIPSYATAGSAGIDLVCTEDVVLYPGETKMIATGVAIHIGSRRETPTHGYMGMIVPRSGLGSKGLILGNTIGIIDEDYQGEIMVCAWNRNDRLGEICISDPYADCIGSTDFKARPNLTQKVELKTGDRFCQLIFVPIIKSQFEIVEEFTNKTKRGASGFGHTDLGSTS